jgi:hypothetical protein
MNQPDKLCELDTESWSIRFTKFAPRNGSQFILSPKKATSGLWNGGRVLGEADIQKSEVAERNWGWIKTYGIPYFGEDEQDEAMTHESQRCSPPAGPT